MSQREVWIDVTKGIGIIAVVFGHVLQSHTVFLWHMPLFFVLAGWNYHRVDTWQYIKKLTKRLLFPYFICLFVCLFVGRVFDIETLKISLKVALFGGANLKGVYAVFWFVTVLYCMLLALHFLSKDGIRWWMVFLLLLIGYLPMFHYVELPWNIQVVAMALAYGCSGRVLRKVIYTRMDGIKWYWVVIGIVVLIVLSMIPVLSMDMKYNNFGVPIVSFVLSLICVLAVFTLSKSVEKVMPIRSVLGLFGQGSMVIMYSHMFINYARVVSIENKWMRFVIVLLISLVVFLIVEEIGKLGRYMKMLCKNE